MDVDAEGELDNQHESPAQDGSDQNPEHEQEQVDLEGPGSVPGPGVGHGQGVDMAEMRRRQEMMFARNWEALAEARGQAEDYVKELQRQESL